MEIKRSGAQPSGRGPAMAGTIRIYRCSPRQVSTRWQMSVTSEAKPNFGEIS